MILFRSMLIESAKAANMAMPPDIENYDPKQYVHWHIYCLLQLGKSVRYAGEHWENAKVIAAVPLDKIKELGLKDYIILGFSH